MNAIHPNNNDQHLRQPKYRADIDGLRAIAIFCVVCFHAFPGKIAGGFIGVDIFFVISGFLISSIIFSNLEGNSFSFIEFYSRRIRRIFPALSIVLIASYTFGWFALLADEYKQLGKHIAGGVGFVSNFVLWKESGYFDNTAETKPLLHLWSLAIEEQFYIFWPPLLAFVWKRKWSFVGITLTVAVISFSFNIYSITKSPIAAFYSPASRFWELMIGGLLAYINLHKPHINRKYKSAQSILGFVFVILGLVFINKARTFPGWWALLPALGSFFIISAGPTAWLNRNFLSTKLLVWLGLISYPLYLWHWPMLSFARIVESTAPGRGIRVAAVLTSIFLAWLTYRLIEKPIRFGRHKKTKTVALLLLMIFVGYLGYYSYVKDGFENRQALNNSSSNKKAIDELVGPFWKYAVNDICLNRYPFKEADDYAWWFCMASKDEKPTLILLGNSYANQLYPGFVKNSKLNHHSILSIGTCDPAKDDQLLNANSPCYEIRSLHQRQLIDNIIEKSGSVKYAIVDGLNKNPDPEYISLLNERIDFLEKHRIKVIVFIPHLIFNYDIRGCFLRPFKSKDCEFNTEARKNLNEGFKPLVDHLSKTNPNVLFFDQNELFCDAEKCSMLRDGMPLYRDEHHHISEYGSIELSRIFTRWASVNIPEIFR